MVAMRLYHKRSCGNVVCGLYRAEDESCCSVNTAHTVDLCPDFEPPSAVSRVAEENRMLRRMNRILVVVGRELAMENAKLREIVNLGEEVRKCA